MDEEDSQPKIGLLREAIIGELIPFDDGAAAIKKHPKTLKRMRPPTVYVGRTPYLPKEPFRLWVLNGCKPVEPERRGRGRPRAA
jgi:hypothetical protein